MTAPKPMPLISLNKPAYTNDDFSGSFPASQAVNANYGDYWRCAQTPVANANSGTLIAPVYLAIDLSSVSSAQRQQVVIAWYNDASTGAYNPALISNNYNNVPAAYTIDINTAAGGSLPGSGWSTQITVAGNPYHSRHHAVNMAGANWIRINVTGVNGSSLNNNVQINVDVHDAHLGEQDDFIFYGDSITQRGLDHSNLSSTNFTLAQLINASKPAFYPVCENGGIGGFLSTDGANNINTWLPVFPGRYVGLLYGTNDANNAAVGDPNFGPNFTMQMTTMLNAIVAAGKIPVMPKTIAWGQTVNIQANGPIINTRLAALFAAFPAAIQGPDLWAYFSANQSLINAADVHPTDPAGYQAYRQQWATALEKNIYSNLKLFISRRSIFI